MQNEKFVLYKQFGKYRVTPESNYDNIYTDATKITTLTCDSAKEAVDTLVMYGVMSEEEIINKTGESI